MRGFSSVHTQQPAGPVREIELDPYILLDDDIKYVTQDIRDVSSIFFCNRKNMRKKHIYRHLPIPSFENHLFFKLSCNECLAQNTM